MSEAIDHLTVITQHLHRLPLDTFPSNTDPGLRHKQAPGSHCLCSASNVCVSIQ